MTFWSPQVNFVTKPVLKTIPDYIKEGNIKVQEEIAMHLVLEDHIKKSVFGSGDDDFDKHFSCGDDSDKAKDKLIFKLGGNSSSGQESDGHKDNQDKNSDSQEQSPSSLNSNSNEKSEENGSPNFNKGATNESEDEWVIETKQA